MKKFALLFLTLATSAFADTIVLNNQTAYPVENQSKIAIQWATSAKDVEDGNYAVQHGEKLKSGSTQTLFTTGKINLNIPKKAEYFRVMVWSNDQTNPDLITNWVEIVPDKTYKLEPNHLIPSVLTLGTGC